MPRARFTPWILIALVVAGLFALNGWFTNAGRKQISYTEYRQLVDDGKIDGTVTISDTSIIGHVQSTRTARQFTPRSPRTSPTDPCPTTRSPTWIQGLDVEMTGTEPVVRLLLNIAAAACC